jgi:hypothetical protein
MIVKRRVDIEGIALPFSVDLISSTIYRNSLSPQLFYSIQADFETFLILTTHGSLQIYLLQFFKLCLNR